VSRHESRRRGRSNIRSLTKERYSPGCQTVAGDVWRISIVTKEDVTNSTLRVLRADEHTTGRSTGVTCVWFRDNMSPTARAEISLAIRIDVL